MIEKTSKSHFAQSKRNSRMSVMIVRRKTKQLIADQNIFNIHHIHSIIDSLIGQAILKCRKTVNEAVLRHLDRNFWKSLHGCLTVHEERFKIEKETYTAEQQPTSMTMYQPFKWKPEQIDVDQVVKEDSQLRLCKSQKKLKSQRKLKSQKRIPLKNIGNRPSKQGRFVKIEEDEQEEEEFIKRYRLKSEMKSKKTAPPIKEQVPQRPKKVLPLGAFAFGYGGQAVKLKKTKKHIKIHPKDELLLTRISSKAINRKVNRRMHLEAHQRLKTDVETNVDFDSLVSQHYKFKSLFDEAVEKGIENRVVMEAQTERQPRISWSTRNLMHRRLSIKRGTFRPSYYNGF